MKTHTAVRMMRGAVIAWLSVAMTGSVLAQLAGRPQQISFAKQLKPGLKAIGIISSTLEDKAVVDAWVRAGSSQGVKVIVGHIKSPSELSDVYRQLVKTNEAGIVIIPDPNDDMMTGVGFEFLREAAIADRVGVFVPRESMVQQGALCCVVSDNGKSKAVINQRVAAAIGITVPPDMTESVAFVSAQ